VEQATPASGRDVNVSANQARRRVTVVAAAVLVAILAGSIVLWIAARNGPAPTGEPDVVLGGPVPAQAAQAARDVVSGDDGRMRAALSPALHEVLPGPDAIAPAGSTVELDAGSWYQQGTHAAATGTLTTPGRAPHRVAVGFVSVDDRWRVTVMERLP
jgi:hypothetical protein